MPGASPIGGLYGRWRHLPCGKGTRKPILSRAVTYHSLVYLVLRVLHSSLRVMLTRIYKLLLINMGVCLVLVWIHQFRRGPPPY